MSYLKHSILILCLSIIPGIHAVAQSNGTVSSYSRFGLGLPADASQGLNRSMGGVAQGLRASYILNQQNPASYSAIDSLTFLFDVGMSVSRTFMSQNGTTKGLNNASFDYVNAAFRLRKNLGMSIGFQPYTRIGYDFYTEQNTGSFSANGDPIIQHVEFRSANSNNMQLGGGLHQVYLGAGWQPFNGFSIGANAGFLWGNVNHKIIQTITENGSTTSTDGNTSIFYKASLLSWKGDIGVQYQTQLNKDDRLTFGATVGIGHKIGSEAQYISTQSNTTADTLTTTNGYEIPMSYSFGVGWQHEEKLTLAADVTLEQWGKCTTPQVSGGTYQPMTGAYQDRLRINAGAEYVPSRYDRDFSNRISYRAGAFYSTPYLKINGENGPREMGLTAGIGIPITNYWANLSYLNIYAPSYVNIGLQWTNRSASAAGLPTENIFQINIGLSFSERWFLKWKFK